MVNRKKFIVSHAPFWHNGSGAPERNIGILLAALPAALFGILQYGIPALGVMALSVSSAMLWELGMNRILKRPVTIGDGNAALIGLLFAMLVPATMPWWAVLTGTFVAVVIGKQIFGGIGGNSFQPSALSIAILTISWPTLFNFDAALLNYDLGYTMVHPLAALKNFGPGAIDSFGPLDLLLGRQIGSLGSACGLALIAGGAYLIYKRFIRWEISVSFLGGIIVTALLFQLTDPAKYAGPEFHLLTGYTLIGAFFLATEDSSSPVNFLPMLIYGGAAGVVTMLIRNIGAYPDGVIFAILVVNLVNPLIDKIRPKAIGKAV